MTERPVPLVRLAWLLRHLPAEAALADNDGYSRTDFLLFDLVRVHTGEPHPHDPRLLREQAEKRARLAAGAERSAARRARLGIAGSVLRKPKE